MTINLTAPGVYIQELPSGSRSISGVSTSLTAFVGPALRGPIDQQTKITSWSDYERRFGGLWVRSTMSQVVRQYFINGGAEALIVRAGNADSMVLQATEDAMAAPGFDHLEVEVLNAAGSTFDLAVRAVDAAGAVIDDGDEYSFNVAVDLGADPAGAINGAQTAHPVSLVEVAGDVVTEPPPERVWVSADNGTGTHVVTIGSHAASAAATVPVGLLLRATPAVQALSDFDHLTFTVSNSDPGAGTFDLEISAVDAGGVVLDDGADYTVTLTGLDVALDLAGAISAGTTPTPTPIALVEAIGTASDAVPPDGTFESADADGVDAAVLATATLQLVAASPGIWGDRLEARASTEEAEPGTFHLTLTERDASGATAAEEVYYNVSTEETAARFVGRLLELQSSLARLAGSADAAAPGGTAGVIGFTGGDDGSVPRLQDIEGSQAERTGMYALLEADLFNLLCLPQAEWSLNDAGQIALWASAVALCERRRAFLLIDPPAEWTSHAAAVAGAQSFPVRSNNAALYFPPVRVADPLQESRLATFPPCGVVAGVMARTDAQRGVWKAPAGIDAALRGVPELALTLTDPEHGDLNPLGINCLRAFPVYGRVIWGARTLNGADVQASEWKYVPIRRLALFLEESLYRGSRWAVFEPNDESLWAQLRLGIGAFMHRLFRQGAFQGAAPAEAYFVKCDSETTTQADIDRGVVNVLIGFAPLKPAEFVIIKLQQLAAQAGR